MIGITLPNRQGFDDLVFSHPKMIFGKHIHMFASIEIDLLFTFFLYASSNGFIGLLQAVDGTWDLAVARLQNGEVGHDPARCFGCHHPHWPLFDDLALQLTTPKACLSTKFGTRQNLPGSPTTP